MVTLTAEDSAGNHAFIFDVYQTRTLVKLKLKSIIAYFASIGTKRE